MKKSIPRLTENDSLRMRAEEKLKRNASESHESNTNDQRLLHELQVHQVELEMQNEELKIAVEKANTATALYDFAPCGYFTMDRETRICGLNLAASHILGSDRSILMNTCFRQFVSKNSINVFNAFFGKIFDTSIRQSCEAELNISGKLAIFIRLDGIVSDDDQKCFISATDITEIRKKQDELKESYLLLRIAGKTAKFGSWSADAEESVIRWSDEVCNIFEVAPGSSPLISSWIKTIKPELREIFRNKFNDCFEKGIDFDETIQLETPYGKLIWIRATGEPVMDNNGKIIKVCGSIQDITVIKDFEEKIKRTNERLNLAFTASNSGSWDWDISNDVFYFFDELRRLFGMDLSAFPSLELWKKTLHPEDAELAENALNNALKTRKQYNSEYRIILPDNKIRWIHAVGIATYDGDRPLRFIGLAIDNTERKIVEQQIIDLNKNLELEVELRTQQLEWSNKKLLKEIEEHKKGQADLIKARTEAEHANRAKSDFLAGISHEIRTPMNAILGYSELLIMKSDDNIQKGYLESIKLSGRTLINLINDILYMSRIEAGRMQLEFNYIDTISFFNQFKKIFEFKLNEKNLRYTTQLSKDLPSKLYADAALLRQIILNIVGNAINFTQKGGVDLVVSSQNKKSPGDPEHAKDKTDLIIKITDTGIGIPEEFQSDIFTPFVQAKAKTSRSGAGLGLSIAHRLVGLMNGTISLVSTPGKGSIFTISIPGILQEESMHELIDKPKLAPPDIPFKKATILVIDPSVEERKVISEALAGTELTVLEASNGTEALEHIRKSHPALIISDIRLPGMNCIELLNKLNPDENLKQIPLIVRFDPEVTNDIEIPDMSRFAGSLKKPLQRSELYSVLLKNLPYRTQVEPEIAPDTEKTQVENPIVDYQVLMSALEGKYFDTWKNFEKRQPIGEVRNFAQNLIDLGVGHNSSIVLKYGEELKTASDSFNIESILRLIKLFPEKVDSLKK